MPISSPPPPFHTIAMEFVVGLLGKYDNMRVEMRVITSTTTPHRHSPPLPATKIKILPCSLGIFKFCVVLMILARTASKNMLASSF